MKIATWCVSSVNRRLPYLRHWLCQRQPDLVALQKILVSSKHPGKFPTKEIEEVGYRVEVHLADDRDGLGSVAVLARQDFPGDEHGLVVRQRGLPGQEAGGRLLIVDAGPVQVASVYAPYDPCRNIRRSIGAKVDWLRCLKQCVAEPPSTRKPMFLCGDFNVALDGESKPDTLNHSREEQEALRSLIASGFADLYRDFHHDGRKGLNYAFDRNDPPKARLHLVLGPSSLVPRIKSAEVDCEYRKPIDDLPGKKWAPGAPVIVEIDGDWT